MSDQITTAVIGYGASGQNFHAPFLHASPHFKMKTVVERNRNEAVGRYPYIHTARSADEVFSDPEIELVVITTPNDSHFELAFAALQAGKHVVVEKPFTTTSAEALELIRLGRSVNRMLSVFHSRRFEGDFLTLQKVLAEGLIGDVVEFESQFDRFRPEPNPKKWKEENRPGIGLVFDLGSHVIDQTLVLFGLPVSVNAQIRSFRENSSVDDYFFIQLEYPGHIAHLRASSFVLKPGPRYAVHGKKGSFLKYGLDRQEELLKQGRTPDEPGWVTEEESEWGTLYTPNGNEVIEKRLPTEQGSYMAYYDNVYETIRHGAAPAVRPEDVYQVIRLIELAMESSRLGKTVKCSD